MATGPSFSWAHLGLAFAGGTIGSAARMAILMVEDPAVQEFTIPLINIAGSFLLGLLFGWAGRLTDPAREVQMRTFWGVGVLGGFTTYSAFAVLALDPRMLPLAAVTVLLGLAAAVAGLWLSRPRPNRPHTDRSPSERAA